MAGTMALGDAPSEGFPAANLAVWHFGADGSWEGVAGGADDRVTALAAVGGGRLAAGGWFSTAGAAAAARVAVFDPAARTWSPLDEGLSDGERGASWALALAQGEAGLWVGGQFPVAGGAPSANLALWARPRP